MHDEQAGRQISVLLERYTVGSVLHLLADRCRLGAEDARRSGDVVAYQNLKSVEHTLFVVGIGIDAANPSAQ